MNYRGGIWEGGGGQDGVEWGGRKWDNCNSIINKYIFKKEYQCLLVFLECSWCLLIIQVSAQVPPLWEAFPDHPAQGSFISLITLYCINLTYFYEFILSSYH